jgi:hypothetical protein
MLVLKFVSQVFKYFNFFFPVINLIFSLFFPKILNLFELLSYPNPVYYDQLLLVFSNRIITMLSFMRLFNFFLPFTMLTFLNFLFSFCFRSIADENFIIPVDQAFFFAIVKLLIIDLEEIIVLVILFELLLKIRKTN